MEKFRPLVQNLWNACENIQVVLARREPLSLEERELIEMACVDLLSKLHEADISASADVWGINPWQRRRVIGWQTGKD